MNYSDLNLKINTDTKCISILPGQDINILQYLPIEEKNDIIQLALQNSEEHGGIYNNLKLDMFFKLYIVYTYTDLIFTPEEKTDATKLYNELTSNGIMEAIINSMNQNEYSYLLEQLQIAKTEKTKYRNNFATVIRDIVENLPSEADSARKIIEEFDPNKFQRVIEFARNANGNRPID